MIGILSKTAPETIEVTKEEEGSPTSHLLRIIDVLIRVMKCLEYVRTYGPSSVRRKKVSGGSNTPSTLSSVRRDIRALFELTNRSIQRRFIEAIYLNGGFFIYLFFILFIYFILFYFRRGTRVHDHQKAPIPTRMMLSKRKGHDCWSKGRNGRGGLDEVRDRDRVDKN